MAKTEKLFGDIDLPPDRAPDTITLLQAMQQGIARLTRPEWRYRTFIELSLFRDGEGWGMGPLARFVWLTDGWHCRTGEFVIGGLTPAGWLPWRSDVAEWPAEYRDHQAWADCDQEGSIDAKPAAPPREAAQ